MRRRLLNLLTAVSLLLCVAAATLWVRSKDSGEVFVLSVRNRFHLTLASHRGGWFQLSGVSNRQRIPHQFSDNWRWRHAGREWEWHERHPEKETRVRLMRGTVKVPVASEQNPRAFHGWSAPMPAFELASPLWPLVATAAALPVARLVWQVYMHARRVPRWHRARRGQCTSCGYDLRASAERCPECGESPRHLPQPFWAGLVAAISRRRRVAIAVVSVLFAQSLAWPLEVVHSHDLLAVSARGCLILLTRESDIFVSRVWLPYPVLAVGAMLRPLYSLRRAVRVRP